MFALISIVVSFGFVSKPYKEETMEWCVFPMVSHFEECSLNVLWTMMSFFEKFTKYFLILNYC
jgi:hypothetical protein